VIPFFAFPPEVRRIIYTTNALESLHAQVRTIIKTRGHFPSDEAATKLIWLALRNITGRWALGRGPQHWKPAMNQFAILYGDGLRCRARRMAPSRDPSGRSRRGTSPRKNAWTPPSLWPPRTRPHAPSGC
jgi:hypothetical protein